MAKIKNFFLFFRDVKKEMKKVSWLNRKESLNKTLIVFGFVIVMGLVLSLFDYIGSTLMDLIMGN